MAKVVIFGNGKIAEVAAAYLRHDSDHEVVAFCCDEDYIGNNSYLGLPLHPFDGIECVYPPAGYKMFIAIGYHDINRLRAKKFAEAKDKGYELISYVSTRSWPGPSVITGENCMVLDGVSIQPGARIGDNVALWSNVVVGHHASIGHHCWLASGTSVGGGSTLSPYCFAGLNATIGNDVTIGERSILGANSLITKHHPAESVIVSKDSECLRLDTTHFLMISKLK